MIYFVVPREQEFGIRNYVERWAPDLAGMLTVLHYEELPRRTSVPGGTYLFTALDQLTDGGLRLVHELQAQLRVSPAVRRVLNDPKTALTRLGLLEELYRQGLNRHRAVRASGALGELSFPVFLREEFRHTGSLSPLLRTSAELERAMGRALLQGYRLRELLVVEFYETVDEQGRYRKYSAYVVGSEVFARGMARGREWMLKADGIEFSEEMLLEERAYVLDNPYESQLLRIFAASGIEYGRIDFAVKDGVVETWEINTNPTVGPGHHTVTPESLVPMRQPIRDHFNRRFRAALEAVDSAPSTMAIPVAFSADCLRGATPIVRPPPAEAGLVRFARVLRPLRPLLEGAARMLSPLLARTARRFQ